MHSDSAYLPAIPLVPWIAFGFAALGMGIVSGAILALFKHTRTISIWVLISTVFNLALNFVLVPRLGPLGAAVMTLLSYVLLFVGQYRHAQRLLPLRYPWGRIAAVGGLSLAVSFSGAGLKLPSLLWDAIGRFVLLAAWGLVAAHWFRRSELRELWKTLQIRA